MNILIVGNISTGKTSIKNALQAKGFISSDDQYHSIDNLRLDCSDGTMAGEFYAWANMLEAVQHPHPSGNSVYEFSGTGKNAWFFRECMKYSQEHHNAKWLVVYCLCDRNEIVRRVGQRDKMIPIPYKGLTPMKSLDFIGDDLKKKFGTGYWADANEMPVRTDTATPEEIADQILERCK